MTPEERALLLAVAREVQAMFFKGGDQYRRMEEALRPFEPTYTPDWLADLEDALPPKD